MPYQVNARIGYTELHLSGTITRIEQVTGADSLLSNATRLLVDFSDVEQFNLDPYEMVAMAKRKDELGVRVAVYAPRPALFGVNRQVLQLAGVREGETARVFKDLAAARAWLLAG